MKSTRYQFSLRWLLVWAAIGAYILAAATQVHPAMALVLPVAWFLYGASNDMPMSIFAGGFCLSLALAFGVMMILEEQPS